MVDVHAITLQWYDISLARKNRVPEVAQLLFWSQVYLRPTSVAYLLKYADTESFMFGMLPTEERIGDAYERGLASSRLCWTLRA